MRLNNNTPTTRKKFRSAFTQTFTPRICAYTSSEFSNFHYVLSRIHGDSVYINMPTDTIFFPSSNNRQALFCQLSSNHLNGMFNCFRVAIWRGGAQRIAFGQVWRFLSFILLAPFLSCLLFVSRFFFVFNGKCHH